jgi:hypothetical protein
LEVTSTQFGLFHHDSPEMGLKKQLYRCSGPAAALWPVLRQLSVPPSVSLSWAAIAARAGYLLRRLLH